MPSRGRLRLGDEAGFSLVETMFGLGVLLTAFFALAFATTIGFRDIGQARQRQGGNQIANKILEQVRGVRYSTLEKGLATGDLGSDPRVVLCSGAVYYFRACPSADPAAEEIVHTNGLPPTPPLVPHRSSFGPPDYPNTYTSAVYLTVAKDVPESGAYRATVVVTWTNPQNPGARNSVEVQTLLYQPEGSTDPDTNPLPGSGDPFFFATGSLSRGSVTVTPNPGVSGGVGIKGLPGWESIAQETFSLDANVQQQQLIAADGQVTLSGVRTLVGGVETLVGAASSSAVDTDPGTAPSLYSAPASVTQPAAPAELAGGGNRIRAGDSTLPSASCASVAPVWLTGFEHGRVSTAGGGLFNALGLGGGSVVPDATVKRNGAYSLRVAQSLVGTTFAEKSLPAGSRRAVRLAIRFPTLPALDVRELVVVNVADGVHARLGFDAAATRFRMSLGSQAAGATKPVTAGTWSVIDILVDASASPRMVEWQIDEIVQPIVSEVAGASNVTAVQLGTADVLDRFVANYDDVVVAAGSDYPILVDRVLPLRPDGIGGQHQPEKFADDNGTPVDALSYTRLDDPAMNSTLDYVAQVSASNAAYVDVTFQNTAEACIPGVQALMAYNTSFLADTDARTSVRVGRTDRVIYSGPMQTSTLTYRSTPVAPEVAPWTGAAVNGLSIEFGRGEPVDAPIRWHAFLFEYAASGGPPTGGGSGGGSTVSATAATSATPCTTQVDARPCSYARQDYTTNPASYLGTIVNLAGSGGGSCELYRLALPTASGSTSYVHGRRAPGTGGAGTVREDIVRHPGVHEFGRLCTDTVSRAPVGWPGYLIRYDPEGAPSSVRAEAGVGANPPQVARPGRITYWTGAGYDTMSLPDAGGSIPVAALDHSSNGWRYEITASLSVAPTFYSQDPPDASMTGTANRTEAQAVAGAPVVGTFTYRVTRTGTGEVVVDLTVAVDLGTLTATARYQP